MMHVASNSEMSMKNKRSGDEQQFVYSQLPSTRRHSFTSLEVYWHQYNYRSILRETRSCDIILSETMDSSWNNDSSSAGSSGLPSKPHRKTPVYMQPRDPSPKPTGDPYEFVDDDEKEEPIVVGVVGRPERYGNGVREARIKLVHRNKERGNERNGESEKKKRMRYSSPVSNDLILANSTASTSSNSEHVDENVPVADETDTQKMVREALAYFEQTKKKCLEEHPDRGNKHSSVSVATSPIAMAREALSKFHRIRKEGDMENFTPQKLPPPIPEVRTPEIFKNEDYLAMCREVGILPANDFPLRQKTPKSFDNQQNQQTPSVPMNALLNSALHVQMQSMQTSAGRIENHGFLVPREQLARTVRNAHSNAGTHSSTTFQHIPTTATPTQNSSTPQMNSAVVRYQPPPTPIMPPHQQLPPAQQELANQQIVAYLHRWNKQFMEALPARLSLDPSFLFRHFGANGLGNQPFQHMVPPGARLMIPNHTQQLAIQQSNQIEMQLAIRTSNSFLVPNQNLPNHSSPPMPNQMPAPIHRPLPVYPNGLFWNHGHPPPHGPPRP
ncbi:hypothetical protein L3Y34_011545 [Caenorhabditis briggsae]|uniref:Uncharacterized protein n=1 Tax=Caenorhabditis briggsae TaxID=6238 RepID=A0AAE8ZRY6_CAEBR|nr:hypothetical protein L3Y34_011545 [Caenorhabditis briggsae]